MLLDPTKIRNLPRRQLLFWRQIQSLYRLPCLCPYSKVRRISPDADPRYFNWKKCPVAHGIRTCSEAQIILLAEIAEVEAEVPDPRTFGGHLTATVIKSKDIFFVFAKKTKKFCKMWLKPVWDKIYIIQMMVHSSMQAYYGSK